MNEVNGLILCGGRSSRMGSPKHKLEYQGKTLLHRSMELFQQAELPTFLSINSKQEELLRQYDCLIDDTEHQGPLGGICTALKNLKSDLVVIPIDMPGIEVEMIKQLMKNRQLSAFQWEARLQPFPSYWPAEELVHVERALAEQKRSVIAYLQHRACALLSGKNQLQFKNLNELKDLI